MSTPSLPHGSTAGCAQPDHHVFVHKCSCTAGCTGSNVCPASLYSDGDNLPSCYLENHWTELVAAQQIPGATTLQASSLAAAMAPTAAPSSSTGGPRPSPRASAPQLYPKPKTLVLHGQCMRTACSCQRSAGVTAADLSAVDRPLTAWAAGACPGWCLQVGGVTFTKAGLQCFWDKYKLDNGLPDSKTRLSAPVPAACTMATAFPSSPAPLPLSRQLIILRQPAAAAAQH
jgi:hypothetical protein